MAFVYILFSAKLSKFYIGSCLNLEERLNEHKSKIHSNSYTKAADDWQLYFEINNLEYSVARKIEFHIKSMKSKNYIMNIKKYQEMVEKLISKFSETNN